MTAVVPESFTAIDEPRRDSGDQDDVRARLAVYEKALSGVVAVCRAAARGDLEPRVPHLGDEPVLLDVRRELNHMLDLTDAFIREASASLEYASAGRFFRRFLVRGMLGSFKAGADVINSATAALQGADERLQDSTTERERLAADFESVVLSVAEHVSAAATEMEASSRSLAESAEHTAGRAAEAVRGSQDASSGVSSVAAGVEELVSTVGEIERQAGESNEAGQHATEEAEKARNTVRELEGAAGEISQIVTLINSVASQTRLLALNATIEAARAGSAGKGFAVVASEVKELSTQTARSTDLIAAQVDQIQKITGRAVAAIGGVADTVRAMSERTDRIAHAIGEQRVATAEMSRNTQEVLMATTDVSRNVEEVTSNTTQTSEAAGQMTAATSELSKLAEQLKTEVETFLANIRGS